MNYKCIDIHIKFALVVIMYFLFLLLKVLSPYFGGMTAFVKDTELLLERDRARITVNESKRN